MIRDAGHEVLRLPPYNPDLNPIEMVWATVKQYLATINVTLKLELDRSLQACNRY